MVAGWRKAFHTSKDKDSISKVLVETNPQHLDFNNINGSPQNNLRCRTSDSNSSLDNKSNNSPKWSLSSSPNSPSSYYTLLKSTLGLSKSLCGICSQSVKTGEGKAIFTAECSHVFHFPCIAAHVKNQQIVTCPVCGTNWNDLQPENTARSVKTTTSLKLPNYNDDEPLLSSTFVSRFNTIPESDENEEEQQQEQEGEEDEENKETIEFQGFGVSSTRTFDAFLLPESALMASNKSFKTLIAVLKVKAKPCNAVANRPPVDLVTVLDIGCSVSGEDFLMLKHSMQVVISSLGSSDRLSVVTFSGGSKRLFPLRRMTGRGRRSARRIVDALVANEVSSDEAPARKEAVMKAAKILEDRRQKNPVTKIILLTNSYEDRRLTSTRFSNLEIPVHALNYSRAVYDSAFTERVGNLLRVVAQDIKFEFHNTISGEISAVKSPYSATLGDIHAAEERELVVELKVPSSHGSHSHVLSVRSSYRDPFTQEFVHSKERMISTPRALPVGSLDSKIKRLIRLHVSTRTRANADVKKPNPETPQEWLRRLQAEEKVEPFTPISAWKAAEKLAKVAMMRKSMNKVSDLHGFEDARF
ncbi:E3 ubiquitin-protein ligase WAVH1-like [Vicia villosa]|uniref:E3 ubiquitin-protein ligase WAVH1-like n=1 Tax=Vicia villosa TaxID=3911 RepID=UPI00273CA326|nr:E3 ubiquitin-protein ligase WAVH1-like [Vicia villosa]